METQKHLTVSDFELLVGQTLNCPLTNKHEQSIQTRDVCRNFKVILVYFGGKWCPHCPRYANYLAGLYKRFKGSSEGKNLEIIFVSGDETHAAYWDYRRDQPWLAASYNTARYRHAMHELAIEGIPSVAVFRSDRQDKVTLVTIKGRESTIKDRESPRNTMEKDSHRFALLVLFFVSSFVIWVYGMW